MECYAAQVASAAAAKKSLTPELPCLYETELVRRLSGLTDRIAEQTGRTGTGSWPSSRPGAASRPCPAASGTRFCRPWGPCGPPWTEAETLTASDCWPYPTYGDLLFSVR